MPRLVFLLEGGVFVQKTNFEILKFIRGILVRFPFVRTYRPYHSRRHETFTFTKNMEREEELYIHTYIHTYIYLIKQVKLHKMAAKG